MQIFEIARTVNFIIAAIFIICYSYQLFYIPVTLLHRRRPSAPAPLRKYAVLISARNEQQVIAQLLDSIDKQDYPRELITVFVVADNCTDLTAEVAASHGAIVYRRSDMRHVGKGYALNYLLRQISRDFGQDAFDGYFVFDADNLLKYNYISEMNKVFSARTPVVTSYRNSKNYGDNWISAGYSLWFLRESEFLNHARMLLGTSCAVSGTGFLFSREILKSCGGWHFFLLTEDIEFTVHNVLDGVKIGYCGSAVLYDEQPVRFSQSWKQRLRWSKGYLQVFNKYGLRLFSGIFKYRDFSCFDMSMSIMPAIVLSFLSLICNFVMFFSGLYLGQNVLPVVLSALESIANTYLLLLFIGAVTTATQWKHIHTTTLKKLAYTLTFPLFMLTYIPISLCALFARVEWKPIDHNVAVSIDVLESERAS